MPKNIPIALLEQFRKPGTSTCFLVKVRTTEDGILGFATADFLIRADDGEGEVLYYPDQELMPQNIQSSADMTVDNTQLMGWFSQAVEQKVLAGAFSAAEITIYRVSYLRLDAGMEVVGYGTVGEIQYNSDAKDKRKVEFRSLTQQLTKNTNDLYSLTCRAAFGDERCGMPFVWFTGTVQLLVGVNNQLNFKVNGIAQPANYFELGVLNVLTGPNAGADLEIESWAADGTVKLSFPSPYVFADGISVRLRRDCNKTETDCFNYSNMPNMRAEHLTPVQDQALMVPGAYIKSQNSL